MKPTRIVELIAPYRREFWDLDDLEEPAADVSFTTMEVMMFELPDWTIRAHVPGGLTCRHVFDAIYEALQVPLTAEERAKLLPPGSERQKQAQRAFEHRCKTSKDAISYVLQTRGMLRLDMLGENVIFNGLARAVDDRRWVLNLKHRT
ncbi:hypothetical protein EUX98_g1779 [Antrodiella citrinella]|uniref:DUF6699 domain-containing protein n=1 Tax=Antrodiella citrinella TaxID=2447956 RepID=A0A4S4N0M1_9APHY|nr:hypothetical protein EUX98_g1779 [Antrodiella citrinella]